MNHESSFDSCLASPNQPRQIRVPKLLVSVRDSQETLAAFEGGADWIDLKEPNAGSLAAVGLRIAEEAVQSLAGRRTMSAALGELLDWHDRPAGDLLKVAGLSVVKLGLAGCARQRAWPARWQAIAATAEKADKKLAAVIYADWRTAQAPTPAEVIATATSAVGHFLLIDTYDKRAGSTLDHFSRSELHEILQRARHAKLTTVLAGSMTAKRLDQLPDGTLEMIDMVAIRGAACRGDRTSRVESRLVKNFRKSLMGRAVNNQAPVQALR